MRNHQPKTILFLSAAPANRDNPRSNKEFELLDRYLKENNLTHLFQLIPSFELTPISLYEDFQQHEPLIIHFSGHGKWDGSMEFTDNPIEPKLLHDFFSEHKEKIKGAFFNYCYSIEVAKEVSKHIKHVIALSTTIPSESAIHFSKCFYDRFFKSEGFDFIPSYASAKTILKMKSKDSTPLLYFDGKEVSEETVEWFASYSNQLKSKETENEKELVAAQEKSQNKIVLDFVIENRNNLGRRAAQNSLKSKKWDELDCETLRVELAGMLMLINDALVKNNKQNLAAYQTAAGYPKKIYIKSLDYISDLLNEYGEGLSFSNQSIKIYLEYLQFMKNDLTTIRD